MGLTHSVDSVGRARTSRDLRDRAETQYPQWVGRRDKQGMPLYVYEIAGLDLKKVASYEHAQSLK